MEREAAVKLMRALVDAGYIADDQRADAAIEKVALEAGLNREQFKAALKYAREQKWVAETNKAAWSVLTQAGIDAANKEYFRGASWRRRLHGGFSLGTATLD